MDQFRAGKRHGPVGSPVKRAVERDDAAAVGVPARQLERGLDGLRPAVGEEYPLGRRTRGQFRQALRQIDLRTVIEVGPRHVQEFRRLVLNGRDHLGMTMTRGRHRDPGREVERKRFPSTSSMTAPLPRSTTSG